MQFISTYQSPLGEITMASDGEALIGVWFCGQKYFASTLSTERTEKNLPIFEESKRWLDEYFEGHNPNFMPAIHLKGTSFQLTVWQILASIPYGQTITYGDIAQKIASTTGRAHISAQAVGNAVSHNPISIFVPCHRVVGANGNLTGYAGGIEKKDRLLELEHA